MQAGLACFRDGALLGSAGLESFTAADEDSSSGDGVVVEEAVDGWLRGLRVLHQSAASSNTAGGGQKPEPASDEVRPPGCTCLAAVVWVGAVKCGWPVMAGSI